MKITEYEIFEGGKLVNTIKSSDEFYNYLADYVEELQNKGYTTLKERMGEYRIMVNYKAHNCKFLAYRIWFGFRDKDGRKIYEGDYLINKDGYSVDIIEDSFNDGVYKYRVYDRRPLESSDYVITDMDFIKNDGVVVKRPVFNF